MVFTACVFRFLAYTGFLILTSGHCKKKERWYGKLPDSKTFEIVWENEKMPFHVCRIHLRDFNSRKKYTKF